MSNLETLLNAWLNDGEVPAGFEPETRIEEYLVAILDGVDDDVTPESRADVLLDAIAAKYAGYADGISDLRDETGMTEHHVSGSKPDQIAAFLRLENTLALQDLTAKGATGVNANTTDILNAYANLPSGGGAWFNDTTTAVVADPIRGNSSATLSGFGVSDHITIIISEAN